MTQTAIKIPPIASTASPEEDDFVVEQPKSDRLMRHVSFTSISGSFGIGVPSPESSTGSYVAIPPTSGQQSYLWMLYSRWFRPVARRLDQLSGPAQAGIPHPSPAMTTRALDTLLSLLPPSCPTPAVIPDGEGGIELIWQKAGWDAVLEIPHEGPATVWTRQRRTGEMSDGSLESPAVRRAFLDVVEQMSVA